MTRCVSPRRSLPPERSRRRRLRKRPSRARPSGRARRSRPAGDREIEEDRLKRERRPKDDGQRRRVLVIDDDEQLCSTICEVLRDDGYAAASVSHGAAALEMVKVHEPALILLDLRMPIMDGWSFVEQYRRAAVSPAAILLLSANPDLPGIARHLGADGQLRKPFELSELRASVAALLGAGAPPRDSPG